MMNRALIYIAFLLSVATPALAYDAITAMGLAAGDLVTEDAPAIEPTATPEPIKPASSCGRDSLLPVKTCDIGAGFVCLNTPKLSVVDDYIMLRGTIDVKNSTLTSLTASVQNEYTNEYSQVAFPAPKETSDCWKSSAEHCLDADGYFSIKVPLGQKMGPYTVVVNATRSSGSPAKETLRVARVTAPNLTASDIKLEQGGDSAVISIDLLHSCQFCDFLGISNGGMEITVSNIINTADGGTKQVKVRTDTAAQGIFSLCIPTEAGTNNITVSACNAATGFEPSKCPTVQLEPFGGNNEATGITWLTPVESIYTADYNPTVKLSFKLVGTEKGTCEENNVLLAFNRDEEKKLCAAGDGRFELELTPETGINVGVITFAGKTYSFTFGWGELVSPFDDTGNVKPLSELWVKNGGGFAIGKNFLTETVSQILNNFLGSDGFKGLLLRLPKMMEGGGETPSESSIKRKEDLNAIKGEIPFCSAGTGSDSGFSFQLSKEPQIGKIGVPQLDIKQDTISFTLDLEDAKIWAKVFVDKDADGKADKRVLPLRIGFRKLFSPVMVKVDRSTGKPLFLLTSESTDCGYKSKHACTGRPAPIVPKDFIGNALRGGSFVACDSDVEPDCVGVNLLNGQTGMISMTVLDAINKLLYCDGSAYLTYLVRDMAKNVPVKVGCASSEYSKDPLLKIGCSEGGFLSDRGWILPIGLDLLNNQFNVTEDGITGVVPTVMGDTDFYSMFQPALKNKKIGFIRRPFLSSSPTIADPNNIAGYDLGVALGEDMINSLFFLLVHQDPSRMENGVFDWDLHEEFLKKLGFDSVKSCDEYKPKSADDAPPTLCNLRPRVGEMLGSALTANGYFPQKQPIILRLRGNRELAARVSFFKKDEKQYLDVQLGDLDISFFAAQVDTQQGADKYGNMPIKFGADGKPLILSMNPKDPDPNKGHIIKMKLTLLLALEISKMGTNPDDPSKLAFTIRPDAKLTKILFKPVAGGNATVIPDNSLISAFEEKIKYGINIYSAPENAIKLSIPKEFAFSKGTQSDTGIAGLLGIEKLVLGKEGVQLGVEDSQEYIDIMARFLLTQVLSIGGAGQTFTIPN